MDGSNYAEEISLGGLPLSADYCLPRGCGTGWKNYPRLVLITGHAVLALAGICSEPGLVLAASGHVEGMVFVVVLLLGMLIFDLLEKHCQSGSNLNYRQPGNIERK